MSYFKKNNITKFQQLDLFLSLYPVVLMAGLSCSKFRKLTMDEILSPTIACAEEGSVSELVAGRFVSIYEAVSKR
jgi:gamma-glutamyltranspeptidase/glutathione hydrolase